jgi:hypothetical protein
VAATILPENLAARNTAIERAKSGDASALRLALERIQAPLKERSIKIDMPPIEGVNDLPRAIAFVVSAVSKGALTPSEGTAMTGMLGAMRSAFELVDMNARLEAIERALPGPHVGSGAASNHEALQ